MRAISLRETTSGNFVRAGIGGDSVLGAVSQAVSAWETFVVEPLGGSKVALKSLQSGLFVSVGTDYSNELLTATAAAITTSATFEWIQPSASTVSLQASNGHFVGLTPSGRLQAAAGPAVEFAFDHSAWRPASGATEAIGARRDQLGPLSPAVVAALEGASDPSSLNIDWEAYGFPATPTFCYAPSPAGSPDVTRDQLENALQTNCDIVLLRGDSGVYEISDLVSIVNEHASRRLHVQGLNQPVIKLVRESSTGARLANPSAVVRIGGQHNISVADVTIDGGRYEHDVAASIANVTEFNFNAVGPDLLERQAAYVTSLTDRTAPTYECADNQTQLRTAGHRFDGQTGITVNDSTSVFLSGVTVRDVWGTGFSVGFQSSFVTLYDCMSVRHGLNGISCNWAAGVLVEFCESHAVARVAFRVEPNKGNVTERITYYGCLSRDDDSLLAPELRLSAADLIGGTLDDWLSRWYDPLVSPGDVLVTDGNQNLTFVGTICEVFASLQGFGSARDVSYVACHAVNRHAVGWLLTSTVSSVRFIDNTLETSRFTHGGLRGTRSIDYSKRADEDLYLHAGGERSVFAFDGNRVTRIAAGGPERPYSLLSPPKPANTFLAVGGYDDVTLRGSTIEQADGGIVVLDARELLIEDFTFISQVVPQGHWYQEPIVPAGSNSDLQNWDQIVGRLASPCTNGQGLLFTGEWKELGADRRLTGEFYEGDSVRFAGINFFELSGGPAGIEVNLGELEPHGEVRFDGETTFIGLTNSRVRALSTAWSQPNTPGFQPTFL